MLVNASRKSHDVPVNVGVGRVFMWCPLQAKVVAAPSP